MKLRWTLGFVTAAALAISAMGQTEPPLLPAFGGSITAEPANDPAATPDSTLQPGDTLKTYEAQMVFVTVQTYEELGQIAQAVRAGQITSDEAEHLTQRCFELSMIRLQFLETLHQIFQTKVSKEGARTNSGEQTPGEQTPEVQTYDQTVVVLPPASSPDIPEAVVKYLELTPAQIAAIQGRVAEEQKYIKPLLQQLAQSRKALAIATQIKRSSNHQIRKVAIEQSHILERLIIANSHLQRDVSDILTVSRRKKLGGIGQHSVDVTTGLFAQW